MRQKGQLLSLDFLLAIALVVLGFGVATKFSEMAVFEWQEQHESIQTQAYGQNAALLLLSNPQVTCEITNSGGQHVNNCIDSSKEFNQAVLGLPENWDYSVFNKTDNRAIASSGNPDNAARVFSGEVNAIISDGPVSKTDLYHCLQKQDWQGNPYECPLTEKQKQVQVMVWKK